MTQKLYGADIFIKHSSLPSLPENLGNLKLKAIFNRGTKVFPGEKPTCHLTDVHQCRYEAPLSTLVEIRTALTELEKAGFEWVEIHNLYKFD
jgi:hypothetical protein